jgi:hypothetical protein
MPGAQPLHGPPQLSDQDVMLELFAVADEVTRLHVQAAQLAMRLDALASVIADRWQPESLAVIDERDRREMEATR